MLISPLTESLDILLPNLVPTLLKPDAVLGLKELADNLAPILRGGFECRLNANSTQVDLQQCIVREESELELLREFILTVWGRGRHGGTAPTGDKIAANPDWSRLNDFLNEWQSSLQSIPEIWLEFDVIPKLKNNSKNREIHGRDTAFRAPTAVASNILPLPAIFVGLPQDISPTIKNYKIAAQSLDLLLGQSGWCEWQENLERCFTACPHGVFVSYIGVMLSRKFPALRVNVKRLQPDSLIPYLQEIGWQEETEELEGLMKQLFGMCDRITVCLDVGQQVYPQIGLECILLKQPPNEPRWRDFLDFLVAQGLCMPEKAEALLHWPGETQPLNATAPWPEDLIVASLLQPKEKFTVFQRKLSHIKIVLRPQQVLEAKAYLWFEHQWFSHLK